MQRWIRNSIGGIILALAAAGTAQAHEGAGGNLAVGVGVGVPTALSLEVAPTPFTAFELALGVRTFDTDDLYAHLVFKGDIVRLVRGPDVIVPVYVGAGGFIRNHRASDITDAGARVPLGVNFDFTRVPLQIFAELALEATFVSDAPIDHPLALVGMAGARVWF
ncbi:MAG TPA: hypothetical protein VKE22_21835 [Haliangiales bacterium]|nr:hypothetical protein [Haliangiales bacterium]